MKTTDARARFLAHQANKLLTNFLVGTKCLSLSKEESEIFFMMVGNMLCKFAYEDMPVDGAIKSLTELDQDMYKEEGFL